MKHLFLALTASLLFFGCASKHKAKDLDTSIENSQNMNSDTKLGVKDGDMIVQRKVSMNEELRRIQYEVYELEDHVYGNRKYGSMGLYGVLRNCKSELSDPRNGGDGKFMWTEPMERITDNEEDFKIGLDEEKKLVGVSEEFLKDRIDRFKGYKSVLMKHQDEYDEKVAICKTDLNAKKSRADSDTK